MRRLLVIISILSLLACGAGSGRFRIEGRFRNLNQGEFYVYSPDDAIEGFDTIKVSDGRFAYETDLSQRGTFVIIFPNYSEQAVFGEPGAVVTILGDASHLKEMKIKGTKTNEQMAKFRQNANRLSPPEVENEAASFITNDPSSPISAYLLRRYFLQSANPDYKRAATLLGLMLKANPDDGRLAKLKKDVDGLKNGTLGNVIAPFSATATNGQAVSRATLSSKVNVVNAWAMWNFDSQNLQRRLESLRKDHPSDIALLGICVDARKDECKRRIEADSIRWTNVCDGKVWNSPLLTTFGIATVPGNVVIDRNGRVVARNLDAQSMKEKIEGMLKD